MKIKLNKYQPIILKKRLNISTYVAISLCLAFFLSCKKDQYLTIEKDPFLQGRGFGITNATVYVQNGDSARQYFSEKLGFSFGRSKKAEKGIYDGTLVSSIDFPDMSSIQLLSIVDSIQVKGRDSLLREFLKLKEGMRMYSLSSSSLDSTSQWLSSQGFKMDSVQIHQQLNTNSNKKAWDDAYTQSLSLGFDSIPEHAYLPQFTEFIGFPYERMHEFNSFYNMQRGYMNHPNGAVGIAAIKVIVSDLNTARETYLKLGLKEIEDSLNENSARFRLKRNQELLVSLPQTDNGKESVFPEEGGRGVFSILIEVKNIEETHTFLKEKLPEEALIWEDTLEHLTVLKQDAFGVQLEFVQEPKEQSLMAQKLQLNFGATLDSVAKDNANQLYQKYCALCHGENREGYAADNAPSLKSHSLLATSKTNNFLRYTTQYGREGTAMAGYYKELGGPLSLIEIELLLKWLYEEANVETPVELSREPIYGDIELGANVYNTNCAVCHGKEGEGISAPALGNPMLLATATDDFLRYAIKEGRDSTQMIAYKNILSDDEINGVTAFLRSRASGWNTPSMDTITEPKPENYVLNPEANVPKFKLREGKYVSAKQVNEALKDSLRFIILDARSKVAWRQTHIPGSIPVPYYEEPEEFIKHIPNDSTWIVAYCACPHAASGKVIGKLNKLGYKKTAILDEGILIWAQQGYPINNGQ